MGIEKNSPIYTNEKNRCSSIQETIPKAQNFHDFSISRFFVKKEYDLIKILYVQKLGKGLINRISNAIHQAFGQIKTDNFSIEVKNYSKNLGFY